MLRHARKKRLPFQGGFCRIRAEQESRWHWTRRFLNQHFVGISLDSSAFRFPVFRC